MTGSDFIIKKIESFECCVLHAYKARPAEKYYTIGYGHYGPDVTADMVITQAEADSMFRIDILKFEHGVNNTGVWSQNEFDALLDFSYNCGLGSLQNLMKLDTREEMANKMLEYCKDASGTKLPGLVARRQFDHDLFLSDSKPGKEVTITADVLNVRRQPGTSSDIVGHYTEGQKVRVLETWSRTVDGWIAAEYTKPSESS